MPGAAVFVSVGSCNQVLVINASQQIFRWEGAGWQQMDGAAVTGSIGADGTIIVVNAGHQVFRRDGAAWTLLPNCTGGVPAVVARGQIYITNEGGQVFHSFDGGNSWQGLPGALTHCAASYGHLVGCNAGQQLWWMQPAAPVVEMKWNQLEGAATSIGIDDGGNMVCCNAGGQMFEANAGGGWVQMDGAARMVARGRDGTTWCVNAEQNLFRREGGRWVQMPGAATFVAVGSANNVICINAGQQIWRWSHMQNNWEAMDGAAVCGSIGSDGTILVVNAGHEVFRRDGASWTRLNATGGVPAVVHRMHMFISNENGQVYISRDGGNSWQQLPGALSHAAASNGFLVGANAGQQLWQMRI